MANLDNSRKAASTSLNKTRAKRIKRIVTSSGTLEQKWRQWIFKASLMQKI